MRRKIMIAGTVAAVTLGAYVLASCDITPSQRADRTASTEIHSAFKVAPQVNIGDALVNLQNYSIDIPLDHSIYRIPAGNGKLIFTIGQNYWLKGREDGRVDFTGGHILFLGYEGLHGKELEAAEHLRQLSIQNLYHKNTRARLQDFFADPDVGNIVKGLHADNAEYQGILARIGSFPDSIFTDSGLKVVPAADFRQSALNTAADPSLDARLSALLGSWDNISPAEAKKCYSRINPETIVGEKDNILHLAMMLVKECLYPEFGYTNTYPILKSPSEIMGANEKTNSRCLEAAAFAGQVINGSRYVLGSNLYAITAISGPHPHSEKPNLPEYDAFLIVVDTVTRDMTVISPFFYVNPLMANVQLPGRTDYNSTVVPRTATIGYFPQGFHDPADVEHQRQPSPSEILKMHTHWISDQKAK